MDIFDLAVIGGGPAGYSAAITAAKSGLKTALIEKNELGGVCLNLGCIPSKAMLHSAKIFRQTLDSEKFGVTCKEADFNLDAALAHKNDVICQLKCSIADSFECAGVKVIKAKAHIKSKADGLFITAAGENDIYSKNLLICTGSRPRELEIPGADITDVRDVYNLDAMPRSAAIIGGGASGLEAAEYLNALGCMVSVIEQAERIAPTMDKDISAFLRRSLKKSGINILTSCRAVSADGRNIKYTDARGKEKTAEADIIINASGRTACYDGLGIENIGLENLSTDNHMQTAVPGVYAAGDANQKAMSAHAAYRESAAAINNILGKTDEIDYLAIPQVVFTFSEAASIGETLESALAKGINAVCGEAPLRSSGRFFAEGGQDGFCKIISENTSGRLLGVHIAGGNASELIYGVAAMLANKMTVEEIKNTAFPHPTVSEAIKEAVFR